MPKHWLRLAEREAPEMTSLYFEILDTGNRKTVPSNIRLFSFTLFGLSNSKFGIINMWTEHGSLLTRDMRMC